MLPQELRDRGRTQIWASFVVSTSSAVSLVVVPQTGRVVTLRDQTPVKLIKLGFSAGGQPVRALVGFETQPAVIRSDGRARNHLNPREQRWR